MNIGDRIKFSFGETEKEGVVTKIFQESVPEGGLPESPGKTVIDLWPTWRKNRTSRGARGKGGKRKKRNRKRGKGPGAGRKAKKRTAETKSDEW
jgi:hypothetical protein